MLKLKLKLKLKYALICITVIVFTIKAYSEQSKSDEPVSDDNTVVAVEHSLAPDPDTILAMFRLPDGSGSIYIKPKPEGLEDLIEELNKSRKLEGLNEYTIMSKSDLQKMIDRMEAVDDPEFKVIAEILRMAQKDGNKVVELKASGLTQNVPKLVEKALASTVYLEFTDAQGNPVSYGNGFSVSPTLVVTTFHVMVGTAKGTARLKSEKNTHSIQGVVAVDPKNNLALLQVTIPDIKPLRIADSKQVQMGEVVYVVGNQKELGQTVSDSTIGKQANKIRLQMTSPISPACSGGPVLNREGKVIGVAFKHIEGVKESNFLIPSEYMKTLLDTKGAVIPLAANKINITEVTYFKRGSAKSDLKLFEAAILDYDVAIKLKPDYVEAYHNRGVAKFFRHQHLAAIADYDTAIKLKPTHADVYNSRGVAKAFFGQHADAIVDFDTAIKLNPDFVEAYYSRGNSKSGLGLHDAAIADYNTAIRLNPNEAVAYCNRASTKDRIGRHADAIVDYDTAIQLKPDYALAYDGRGLAKQALGQHAAAITDHGTAIDIDPDFIPAYINRGNVLITTRQYAAAISDFDAAIRLNPDFAVAYIGRGLAKYQLDRTSEWKSDFQTALKLATQANDVALKNEIEGILRQLK